MTLRIEPTQARSAARLKTLLDATARAVDEVGIERVTTNLVAERAGCSIGTLYRYFPDRIAILRGLALRNATALALEFERAVDRVQPDEDGLHELMTTMLDGLIHRYRTEPGWSAIAFDHALDLPVHDDEQQLVAPSLRAGLAPITQIAFDVARRFSDDDVQRQALADDIEVLGVITHDLLDRAFANSREGDPRLCDIACNVSRREIDAIVERHRLRRAGVTV